MEYSSCAINRSKPNWNTLEHISVWCLGYENSAGEKQRLLDDFHMKAWWLQILYIDYHLIENNLCLCKLMHIKVYQQITSGAYVIK